MAEAGPAASEDPAWRALPLDNLTLTRKEGFAAFAEARETPIPLTLTMADLRALDPAALEHYNDDRRRFLANLRPIKTMQVQELSADLTDIFDAGVDQPNWQAKGMAAIDAFPGLGKTTIGLSFAKKVHNTLISRHGRFTEAGHERWPVIRVGMMGDTSVKDFNWAMLEFFAHAGRNSGSANAFLSRALDCAVSCQSRLLLVDDLQFLQFRSRRGTELANQFKTIANEFPLMILFIGHDLEGKGLYDDPQLARRITPLGLQAFSIEDEAGREQWRRFLLSLEQRLVLANKYPGMLADDLSDQLYARCSGHIGSLMSLIRLGSLRAMRTGQERLTKDVLAQVKLDWAAQQQLAKWEAFLASGKVTSNRTRAEGGGDDAPDAAHPAARAPG
ncbi:TniB family NTP-binding protein [Streptomyces sp. NBC_01197]|uniref:TniB family NTP-binding protein n=1 Tax=Streptomyces sp. NBC_01197 TaxID=2903768 RepID=UPI002E100867|nr:TniB family NTP-binding protein [Streptomyces sp. NBC_01197]